MKISNMTMESTPVCELRIKPHGNQVDQTEYTFKTYWSANRGMYGYQIGWQIFKDYTLVASGVTGGCGYCKESHAFGHFIYFLTSGKIHGGGGTVKYYLWEYRKGGNFYQCTKAQLLKAVS